MQPNLRVTTALHRVVAQVPKILSELSEPANPNFFWFGFFFSYLCNTSQFSNLANEDKLLTVLEMLSEFFVLNKIFFPRKEVFKHSNTGYSE